MLWAEEIDNSIYEEEHYHETRKEDDGSYILVPTGRGFTKGRVKLASTKQCNSMQELRYAYFKAEQSVYHNAELEKQLVNKTAFIIQYLFDFSIRAPKAENKKAPKAVLCASRNRSRNLKAPSNLQEFLLSLLCDQETLFCSGAKDYNMNHQKGIIGYSKHFLPLYSECDWIAAEEYKRNLKSLMHQADCARELCREVRKIPFDEDESYDFDDRLNKDLTSKSFAFSATRKFFQHSRSSVDPQVISSEAVCAILNQVQKRYKDLWPFRYMVLCVVGSGQLFKSGFSLDIERVLDFQNCIYRKKPSPISVQCLDRMKFLQELLERSDLSKDERRKNWAYFFTCHGLFPMNAEEAALMKSIMKDYDSESDGICFGLSCYRYLQQCIPLQLEYLYCYKTASILHLGGFADFIKKNPSIFDMCPKVSKTDREWYLALRVSSERIERRPKRGRGAELTVDVSNICAIQHLCGRYMRWTKWPFEKEAKEIFNKWVAEYYEKMPSKTSKLVSLNELKSLLIEASIQRELNRNAMQILWDATMKNFPALSCLERI